MRTVYIFNLHDNQLTNEYYFMLKNNTWLLEKYNLYFLQTRSENISVKNNLTYSLSQFNKYKSEEYLSYFQKILNHIINNTELDIIICFPFSCKNNLTILVKHLLDNTIKTKYKIKIIYSFCPVEEIFENNARTLYGGAIEDITSKANMVISNQNKFPDIELFQEAMKISQDMPTPVLISQEHRPTPYEIFQLFDREIPQMYLPKVKKIFTMNRHITAFLKSLPHIYPINEQEAYSEIIALLNTIQNSRYIDLNTWTDPIILKKIRFASEKSNENLSQLLFGRRLIFQHKLLLADNWKPYTQLPINIHTAFLTKITTCKYKNFETIKESLSRNFIIKQFKPNEQAIILKSTKKELPFVSVLTLSRNHEHMIEQNIKSILSQKTNFPIQHIIVLDGSEDDTLSIIKKYTNKYRHIIPILFTRKTEFGDNVRALFEECRSPYAALCDGDDYFTDPHKLQTQVDFMERHKECSLCFHPVKVIYEDGSPSKIYPPDTLLPGGKRLWYSLKDILTVNFIQTNSVMYRWRFQEGLPEWFDPTLIPGDWYWHLLHAETGKIAYLRKPMSAYRRHAASLYARAEKDHVAHRHEHGLNELKTYSVCNAHFRNRYYNDFSRLARGVFADFVQDYLKTKDDELLQKGIAAAPDFARDFLSLLASQNMHLPLSRG